LVRVLNSGVVGRLQPDIVIVTLPVGNGAATGAGAGLLPQAERVRTTAVAAPTRAGIKRLI
jgi:hypothetical protein